MESTSNMAVELASQLDNMSLYGEYIKERRDRDIVENEKGFATYVFMPKGVYIEDIYIRPDYRKQGIGREFADKIKDIALEKGVTKMYGSVVPSTKGSTNSLKALLSYGFSLDSSSNDFIILYKDLLETT